jgi:hypothetical protein
MSKIPAYRGGREPFGPELKAEGLMGYLALRQRPARQSKIPLYRGRLARGLLAYGERVNVGKGEFKAPLYPIRIYGDRLFLHILLIVFNVF